MIEVNRGGRKFQLDLTELWQNPNNRFTVRYRNIDEEQKKNLAKRIKEIAPQRSIKKTTGPSEQAIYETLMEINPIIFTEVIINNEGRRASWYAGEKAFGTYNIKHIAGYNFKNLCRAIYQIDCLKRELKIREIERIVQLTHQDWNTISNFITRNMGNREQLRRTEGEEPEIPEEMGIREIERARATAESNGAGNIPNAMFDSGEQEETFMTDGRGNVIRINPQATIRIREANLRPAMLNPFNNRGLYETVEETTPYGEDDTTQEQRDEIEQREREHERLMIRQRQEREERERIAETHSLINDETDWRRENLIEPQSPTTRREENLF